MLPAPAMVATSVVSSSEREGPNRYPPAGLLASFGVGKPISLEEWRKAMETVIILSVVGMLFVGSWYICNVLRRFGKRLKTDPDSVRIEQKWDWAIWGPFLIAGIVIAWASPELMGFVFAIPLLYWAQDWIWFRYVDWYIARAKRGPIGAIETTVLVLFGVLPAGGGRPRRNPADRGHRINHGKAESLDDQTRRAAKEPLRPRQPLSRIGRE